MKVTIDARTLASHLAAFGFLPKQQQITFSLSGKGLSLEVETAEVRKRVDIACEADGGKAATLSVLPAGLLSTLKSLKGDVQISISKDELRIEQDDKSYKVRGDVVEERIAFHEKAGGFKISGSALKRGFEKTIPFTSTDVNRPALAGVNVTKTANGLRFIGTDGYILSNFEVVVDATPNDGFNVTIPGSVVDLVLDIDAPEIEMYVAEKGGAVGFQYPDGVIEGRLIEDSFPNVDSLLNAAGESVKHTIVLNIKVLERLLRLGALYSGHGSGMDLGLKSDEVRTFSQDVEFGARALQWSSAENGQLDGQRIVVRVNPNYARKILNVIDSQDVVFSFSCQPEKAIVVRPSEEMDEKLTFLLMPVRNDEYSESFARLFQEELDHVAA